MDTIFFRFIQVSMYSMKPVDRKRILAACKHTRALITVEEHSSHGGLGSAVSEIVAVSGSLRVSLKTIAVDDIFPEIVGKHAHLLAHNSLTPQAIARAVEQTIKKSKTKKRGK